MTTAVNRPPALAPQDVTFDVDIRDTYFALRMAAGVIGIILPFVLVSWGLIHEVAWSKMSSLSAFYWLSLSTPADANALLRNWFVGSLVAVGVCLVIYKGYGNLENWLLNCAGLAAGVVALNPMPWPPLHSDKLHVHYTAAVVFFLLIAATIWFCARDTLVAISSEKVRARWNTYYKAFAIAMGVVPVLGFLLVENGHQTIWVETSGVWVFSLYWFVKTYELSRVSMIEQPSAPAPHIRRINGTLEIVRRPIGQLNELGSQRESRSQ